LTIPGGSVVVIVGSNGSGKSTLIRILSRLFTPSLGELIIDGSPAKDFDLVDLRQASILLSQDNKVYPLSLAENIGLGCLELVDDMSLIENAAERGGAAGFISKLDTGYGTVLSPPCPTVMLNLHGDPNHPLHKEVEKLPKQTNISGGETQRLIA
jgi:ABC-type multidrug transport system fused ATPase/permease subunit